MSTSDAQPGDLDDLIRRAISFDDDRRRAARIFVGDSASAPRPASDAVEALEHTAPRWGAQLADAPAQRSELATAMHQRFGDRLRDCPRITEALGVEAVPWSLDVTEHVPSLETSFVHVDVPAGTTLFDEGDEADCVYVISHGRLRVTTGGKRVAELGPNQTVGEMGLLTGRARQGTVIAVRDSVLYRLDQHDFERLCVAHPSAMYAMLVTLASRVNAPKPRGRAVAVPTNIVIAPAGRNAPTRAFADRLTSFLSGHARTRLVTAESIDAELGEGAAGADLATPTGRRVMEFLHELETRYDHLVLLTDDRPTDWSLRCVRQADVVLFVAAADADPRRNEFERRIRSEDVTVQATVRLVLVHPNATSTPTGTAAWLADREVWSWHHVVLSEDAHLARVARFMVGRPSAVVLSGGASRALAHIGVLRALEEAGSPVDVIAGTSAGALVGGQFAMGWTLDQIAERNARVFGDRRGLLDVTPPFTSLIGSAGFNRALERIFRDVRFEDLWVRFTCTTTDLTAARTRVHVEGPLRRYVRASCSLPMVMPPVVVDGHLLADGGIMNNVPVDPLLEITNVGTLVVVNVTNPFYDANEPYNYGDSLSLRRILSSRLGIGEKLIAPGIFDVLMRALEIGSKSLEPGQVDKADLYVRPDVSRFGYTDLGSMPEMIELGYRATVDALAQRPLPAVPFA